VGSSPTESTKKIKKMITKEQLKNIKEMTVLYPNDMDLGKVVRSVMNDNSFIRSIPNDIDLGKTLRKIILEKNNKI
jgi:hypothetical protein